MSQFTDTQAQNDLPLPFLLTQMVTGYWVSRGVGVKPYGIALTPLGAS